jgi:hypothetical protein
VTHLREAAIYIGALAGSLGGGLLLLAVHFHTDIPGHHSATACVYGSSVLAAMAVAAAGVLAVPTPRRLPVARIVR